MIKVLSKYNLRSIVLGVYFFLYSNPVYVWEYRTFLFPVGIISFLIMIKEIDVKFKNLSISVFVFFILLIYLGTIQGNNIFGNLQLILLLPLPFLKPEAFKKSFNVFYSLYCAFVFISLIFYILVFAGFSLPHKTILPYNETKDYTYEFYYFLLTPNKLSEIFRFQGLYEEPGNIGTIDVFILGMIGINYKSLKSWVVIVSGLCSLSLFFYIMFFVIFIINVFYKNQKTLNKVLFLLLLGAVIGFTFSEDTILNELIAKRLVVDKKTHDIAGNNRTNLFLQKFYNNIRWKDPIFYFGSNFANYDKRYISNIIGGSASYKSGIIKFGLFGVLFYLLFYIYYCGVKGVGLKNQIIFFVFFCMILYQRPFYLDPLYIYLFCCLINLKFIRSSNCKKNNEKLL